MHVQVSMSAHSLLLYNSQHLHPTPPAQVAQVRHSFFLFLFLTCSTLRHQITNHNLNTVCKVTAMINGIGVSCVHQVDLTMGEEWLDELHKGLSKFWKECTLHMPR